MTTCPECGTEMSYMSQYGQWYCNNCQQYRQPAAAPRQAPPAPAQQQVHQYTPGAQKPKRKMILVALALVVAILVVVAAIFLVFMGEDEDESRTVTMTFREFQNDADPLGMGFKSVDSGDTLKIKDTVAYAVSDYDDYEEQTVTYFYFESAHAGENESDWYSSIWEEWEDYDLMFKGDLTGDFSTGDQVVVTLHCTSMEIMGIKIETFKELTDDPLSEALPESCIKQA